MRIEKSTKNIKIAWILQLVHILCQFFSRTAIIYMLSNEYVGLSGLFSNVLMILSLAELGIGEAIVFSLYSPIAKNEISKIKSIMRFYKRIYIGVGGFVLAAGLLMTPFIDFFIKEKPDIPNLHLIYVLYVVNTAVSYFFSYKSAYVSARQNNYIVALNNGICEILMVIVQVLILVMSRNYIGFMLVGILFVLIQNISITRIADKRYPYLKEKDVIALPRDIFAEIKKNTLAMVFHKIGTIIVFATDYLIISKFIGLVISGIYANYTMIVNAVTVFISKFFTAISASVGNLAALEDVETQEKALKRVFFINFWLYSFACCCLFNLLNPFINDIWVKKDTIFGTGVVLIIVMKTYFTGMRSSAQTFKNAKGLYWYNKYMPIYESLINLGVSLVLVKPLGVSGVLLGTIVSTVTTCAWIEPYVLYKYGFHKSVMPYYKTYLKLSLVFFAILGVCYGAVSLVPGHSFIAFLIKLVISAILPNILLYIIFRNSDEFAFLKSIIKERFLHR